MPPEFIIIAGPNGTGKSTTSKNILEPYGIVAFDWDKEFHKKWKKFGFDPAVIDGIRESTNNDFQNHLESAFSENQNVSYETNFHSTLNFEIATKARKQGYRASLYFLALKDPQIGVARVEKRVREGGHHVSEITIKERYEIGLNMLDDKAIDHFDRIFIYDSADQFTLQVVLENKNLIYHRKPIEPLIINKLPKIKSPLD